MAIHLQDPVVQSYIFYSAILALKILSLTLLTGYLRTKRKVFANPEDAAIYKVKVNLSDAQVERVRRAHLNDLENIPAFWILGALYVTTSPAAAWATLLFRAFTIARILHTIVYAIVPLPQPTRVIVFYVPYFLNCYMGLQVVLHYMSAA